MEDDEGVSGHRVFILMMVFLDFSLLPHRFRINEPPLSEIYRLDEYMSVPGLHCIYCM